MEWSNFIILGIILIQLRIVKYFIYDDKVNPDDEYKDILLPLFTDINEFRYYDLA
jgi:hypothetical protein